MKEKFLAILESLKLITPENKAVVTAEIDKLKFDDKPAPSVDPSKVSDPAMKEFLQTLSDSNKVLMQQVKDLTGALADEKKAREDAAKIQTDRINAERTAKYEKLITDAKKDGRIVEATEKVIRDKFKDVEMLEYHLGQLKPDKHTVPPQGGDSQQKNSDGTPKQSQAVAQPFNPSRAGILEKVQQFSTVSEN